MKMKTKMIQGLLTWTRFAGIVFFLTVGLKSCMTKQELACDCEQQSLDSWTSAFIDQMNSGEMPEEADHHAEEQSAKVFADCFESLSHN